MMIIVTIAVSTGCGWRGLNSLPMPGTAGGGPGSYLVQAQLPDVDKVEPNSRVQIGDVIVGTVTKIERQAWHALVTMRLDGDVRLPENATAKVGQTSLLGTPHIQLAAPQSIPPQGSLHEGSLIPLSSGGTYPTVEHTLAAVSMLLNGGGIGQVQDITRELSVAFGGHADVIRHLIGQLDQLMGRLNDQTEDIFAATTSLNNLASEFAQQKPILDNALRTLPDALAVLREERTNLVEALAHLGKLSALTANSVDQTKDALVQELKDVGPVLESLANAGPALTRSLSMLSTFPWPKETIQDIFRGDFLNVSLIFDLTLSRLDAGFFTGTRWEGNLTELELQWGRTIGQKPSPATQVNPLVAPYRLDQGR
ncbi:MCE family protein [Mycobacterium deserti]|nr:MCE family protein [Mycobacterium deserti]